MLGVLTRPSRSWFRAVLAVALATVLASSCRPAAAVAPGSTSTAANAQDRHFAAANAQTDLAEIALAKLVENRAPAPAVRALASTIHDDHVAALGRLRIAARSAGVTLPTTPDAMQIHQAAKLKQVPSGRFDLQYLQAQVAGHRTSIANTEAELRDGASPALRAFARIYLPVAQKHLTEVSKELATVTAARAPANTPSAPPTDLVHGSKQHPSSNLPWIIALVVVLVLIAGALGARLVMRARPRR